MFVPLASPSEGVDFSNYGGVLTTPVVHAWQDESAVRFAIAGLQESTIARQQLNACQASGLARTEGYGFLKWYVKPEDQVERWLTDMDAAGARRLWLDTEEDPTALRPTPAIDVVNEWIDRALDAIGTFPAGIYSGEYWWKAHTNNRSTSRLARLPLWHASTFLAMVPTLAMFAGHEYGPWRLPHTWQYRSTGLLANFSVDRNLRFFGDDDSGRDDMIRHNAIATLLPVPTPIASDTVFNARKTFGLPPEALSVQVELYLEPASGGLQVLDGDGSFAFQAVAATDPQLAVLLAPPFAAGRAILDAQGNLRLHPVAAAGALVRTLGCVGYFLA